MRRRKAGRGGTATQKAPPVAPAPPPSRAPVASSACLLISISCSMRRGARGMREQAYGRQSALSIEPAWHWRPLRL